ncbi:MAG: hypothetical protein WD602_08025 [Actinomycetota bacterium]
MATSPAGKNAIKALVANPTARRLALRGAKKAVLAAQSAKASSAESQPAGGDSRKSATDSRRSIDRAANPVITSVARPWAEKLAGSAGGRSVLQALNSVSAEVLRTAQPQSRLGPTSRAGQEGTESEKPPVKFVAPVPAPSSESAPRRSAIKWPPDPAERTGEG